MRHLILASFLTISAQPTMQTAEVFPATDTVTGRPPFDDFHRKWYSKHLVAMSESSLTESPGEAYRFLWLRTFHAPVMIRVVCVETGCELTALRTNGHGGYEPGAIVERKTRKLSNTEVSRFKALLAAVQFWQPTPADDRIGLDGAQWILEGRRGQTYHLWDVWSPPPSGPSAAFRELCLQLVNVSGLAVRRSEIY